MAFRARGGMNADKPSATVNEVLKSAALRVRLKCFVVAVRKDKCSVLAKILVAKDGRIVRHIHQKIVLRSDLSDGLDAGGDVVVNVSSTVRDVVSGINQNALLGGRRFQRQGDRKPQRQNKS